MQNSALLIASSHPELATQIADILQLSPTAVSLSRCPDGEIQVFVQESVRNKHTFIVHCLAFEPERYLFELMLLADSVKRGLAKSVTAVIPYLAYSRQDKKVQPVAPIPAKVIANALKSAGIDRLVLMDLHAEQVEGYFDMAVEVLDATPYFLEAIRKEYTLSSPDWVVVAPDLGGVKQARQYARLMGTEFAFIDKERIDPCEVEVKGMVGKVEGKAVLIVDDICSTAETLTQAVAFCRARGAKKVVAAVTHGLFIGNAMKKINDSLVEKLYVTNSVPFIQNSSLLHTVNVAPLLAKAMEK